VKDNPSVSPTTAELDVCGDCTQASYCRAHEQCHYTKAWLRNPDGTPRRWVPSTPEPTKCNAFALYRPDRGILAESIRSTEDGVWGSILVQWPSQEKKWLDAGWSIRSVVVEIENG
jgi:hypothetical protein